MRDRTLNNTTHRVDAPQPYAVLLLVRRQDRDGVAIRDADDMGGVVRRAGGEGEDDQQQGEMAAQTRRIAQKCSCGQ
jgi:hypothetical protein